MMLTVVGGGRKQREISGGVITKVLLAASFELSPALNFPKHTLHCLSSHHDAPCTTNLIHGCGDVPNEEAVLLRTRVLYVVSTSNVECL